MPTDHAEVSLRDVRVPDDAVFGEVDHGLELAQHFVHENRIRQAASSSARPQFCINEAVAYANGRDVGQAAVEEPGASSSRSWSCTPNALLRASSFVPRAWSSTATTTWRSPTRSRCATTAPTASRATPPTGRCRPAVASATAGTCPSSTSTAITAATASPRAPRRSRCARWASELFGFGRGSCWAGLRPAGDSRSRGRSAVIATERLREVLAPIIGEDVTIENLRALTGGASRGTWAFDARSGMSHPAADPEVGPARRHSRRHGARGPYAATGRGRRSARPAPAGRRRFCDGARRSVPCLRRDRG